MTQHAYFIAGTDTDIGKTHIASALLEGFSALGKTTAAMKPVACGCTQTENGLRNDDALLLQQAASLNLSYEQINPYAFPEPIAPHLAAQFAQQHIDLNRIDSCYQQLSANADITVVEGVGGWMVPFGDKTTSTDLVQQLKLPVILVVGIRLGCLNHALLTTQAIQTQGCNLVGWIANIIDTKCLYIEDNIDSLKQRIDAPLLGQVPWDENKNARAVAGHLNLNCLV